MPAHRLLFTAAILLLAACGPSSLEPEPAHLRSIPDGKAQQPLMYGGHDYLFIRSVKSWWDAKASCEALGYGLVTVNDANEEAWLNSFEGTHYWWIGYSDLGVEGIWRWNHGSSSYTNWEPGQPDNWNNDDCGFDNWRNGRWGDGDCTAGLYFICESLQ